MNNLSKIIVLGVLVSALVVGCSSDDPAAPPTDENQPPTVTFTFNKVAVAKGLVATLTVTVDDLDGDPVTVTWEATGGFLEPQDQGKTSMRWEAPGTVGLDTLTITASDGNGGKDTIQEALEVGTLQAGDITDNTTWDVGNSPYLVAPGGDRISIDPSTVLTINAGVKVYIDKAAVSIDVVGGRLIIAGTPANPVVIEPSIRMPQAGYWIGLRALGASPQVELDYATLSHAVNGVNGIGSAQVDINQCNIMICSEAGIFHESTGGLVVENSAITNNLKGGIRVKLITSTPDFVTIRGDSIAVNGRFSDSVVYTEDEAGISLDFDDAFETVPVEISGNEISRNDFPGIRLITAVFPVINNNGIFGNELRKATNKIDIQLIPPQAGQFPSGEIDAKNNYWGFRYDDPGDVDEIKARIIDIQDNPVDIRTRVLVTPWLHEAPQ